MLSFLNLRALSLPCSFINVTFAYRAYLRNTNNNSNENLGRIYFKTSNSLVILHRS